MQLLGYQCNCLVVALPYTARDTPTPPGAELEFSPHKHDLTRPQAMVTAETTKTTSKKQKGNGTLVVAQPYLPHFMRYTIETCGLHVFIGV